MMELFDLSKNYSNYRNSIQICKGPAIPLMSVISKDLFGIDENNKTAFGELVNVEKLRLVEKILSSLISHQTCKYTFSRLPNVEGYIDKLPHKQEKEIAKESNKCEVRVARN